MNTRMNRARLNIGTYILDRYARTETHIRELAECGIDFVVCMENDRPALDLFSKYGVGAIVSGVLPGWWGGDGENAGRMAELNPPEAYDRAAASFADHPAVWGIDTGDEPSALDFPYYGQVIEKTDRLFPKQFAYLNLYPNYASVSENSAAQTVSQLGTQTYAEYIGKYCANVGTDYICYDFYMYAASVAGAYENLRIVSDACRRTGRSMWIVLQVNSNKKEAWISENQLRFQAYSAMAFGAENIIWACYTAGWWHNQVLDENGAKTVQYEKLKKVNGEIRTLADAYMDFRCCSTHLIGSAGNSDWNVIRQQPVRSLDTGIFFDVHADGGESLVAGQMVSRKADGRYALMICAADDPMDRGGREFGIVFRVGGRSVRALGGEGELPVTVTEDGACRVRIRSCEGVLLIAG